MKVRVLGMYDWDGNPVVSHCVCDSCYAALEPERVPQREPSEDETCCRCGTTTRSGIYYAGPKGAFKRCAHGDWMTERES